MTTTSDAAGSGTRARSTGPARATRTRRLARAAWRGRETDPRWVRPALAALLAATAVLYLVGLSVSGWANPFYSAAAQAGSQSWEAWFYGSSDAANAITVDKPPAALWVTGLSVRLFGLSSWSILVPQALEGVAAVGVLYATVRRRSTPAAGLIAGLLLATTPVAVLMFRFNNPDALLVLLMVAATRGVLEAVDTGRARSLYWAGVFIGLGFLTKQLQVFLVLPGLGLAYLWAAPHDLRRRVRHLLLAAGTVVLAGGWWVAVVELVPDSWRPYVGGSQTNSFLELTLGYNGFGRLTGDETGSVGASNGWGETGLGRMFDADFGGNVSWLLPAAFALAAAGFVLTRRAPRTDARRAGYLAWTGWLVVTFTAFSSMSGIIHPYYSVALAPAVAALVALGAVDLWRLRNHRFALPVLAAVVAVSAGWSFVLLGRSGDFLPWLRWVVLVAGVMGTGLLAAAGVVRGPLLRSVQQAGAVAAAIAVLAGPVAYSLQTASTAHTGAIVSAGPSSTGGSPTGGGGQFGGRSALGPAPSTGGFLGGAMAGAMGGPGAGGGAGLLNATTPGAELTSLLAADAGSYTWVAATTGSNNAAGYQLATQEPVMAVGGFNGTDPAPTLAQFQAYVAAGRIHYYVESGSRASTGTGGSDVSAQIAAWVEENFTALDVDGTTVHDLTARAVATATS
ncbi:ArnT family glycosyltransferase [Kineococcus sp. SYSU DK001]|uniref:ArnT family glycosyltransferase n=1 Tax=Kineococcus sp. SYSU DK001 TaxID=3383122 RepID=UPI003D7DB888